MLETLPQYLSGILGLIIFVIAAALVIAWIVLPFALIGTKPLLRELLAETRRANSHLANVEAYIKYVAEVTKESTDARASVRTLR